LEAAMNERLQSPESRPAAWPASEPIRSHVLIVDDHGPSRRLCAGYLDLFDHTSEMVGSGAAALAALQRERFHVVVMNVHMAETSAMETLSAIRALPGDAGETPVIGLTAVGRDDQAQRWLGAGLAGVLAKPVTAARLYAALNMVAENTSNPTRSWAPAV
jgi:CheY-like chemotaxis protein